MSTPPLPPQKNGGPEPELGRPPLSAFLGPIDGLIRNSTLAPPAIPGVLASLERFEVLQLIGAGGMGMVFLARDPQNGAKVAIKMLKPELAVQPQAVHRFLVEARHLRRLAHPHILGILEASENSQSPFLVMPYLEKGSLARIIQPGQPLERRCALRIARQIASALQYAHNKGIIHRDLKPANILLDNEGNVFLTDFGLARTLFNDSFMDVDHSHCEGTAPYMSPAVAAGQAEDTRCDIYAFGALLYEMLTGKPPYYGVTTAEILEKIRHGPPPPILEVNPAAARDLAQVAAGALARTHRERYASMADIVADLDRIENGHPPLGPHGQWRAPCRWPGLLRGRPWPVAGVAVFFILLAGGWWWSQPRLAVIQSLSSEQVMSWHGAKLGDWDDDKQPEVFVIEGSRCLVFNTASELEAQFAPAEGIISGLHVALVADANRDGKQDVFLSWADGRQAHLAAFNRIQYELFHVSVPDEGPTRPNHGRVHTALTANRLADLDRNGRMEILAVATTGWSSARGVYCFDAMSQAQLWNHSTAPGVVETALIDLDNDGKAEVVFGSAAVSNGIKGNDGTDDDHCYLYAVTGKGVLLWRTELGDTFANCRPLVAASRSQAPRLYAWVQADRRSRGKAGKKEVGRIIELDMTGREIAHYDAKAQLESCLAEDFNHDSKLEILATDRHGFLHVLDADLHLLAKKEITPNEFGDVALRLVAVTNLTPNSAKQLVFASMQAQHLSTENVGNNRTNVNVTIAHHDSIQVLDSSLRRVAQYELANVVKGGSSSVQLADWDHDGVQEIVCLGKTIRVLKLKRGF